MPTSASLDLADPRFKADPFPVLARLRASDPVFRAILADKTPVWLLTRYADVDRLLKDDRFAKNRAAALTPDQLSRQPWVPAMFRPLERNMLDLDPPDHTRLRALVQKAFTPRLVERIRGRIQSVTEDLIDAVLQRGEADLVADFALALPMTIITEILGVPGADRRKFHRWTSAMVSASTLGGEWRVLPSAWMFVRYLRRFIRLRRADLREDLVSALVAAEETGDRLDEEELLAMVFLLLIAGHETTVNLIGSGLLALLQSPRQREALRVNPPLAVPAVEELLRFTSPVFLSTERWAREDVTVQGVVIPRGGLTFGVIGSANRDEAVFPDADALDLARAGNRHLSFGGGIHYCLGAPLARLEAQIAIPTLLSRIPDLRLKIPAASLRWRRGLLLRGLEALPVEFERPS